jgi:hypothetical protein
MRAFWLASFIAWEGYRAVANSNDIANLDLSRFRDMMGVFEGMIASESPEGIDLPPDIPEPGVYPPKELAPEARAAAEIATIATGWAFLHEIRHLQHQQEATGAPVVASSEERHMEELSCDTFATVFILDRANEFAATEGVPAEKVRFKRELGIYVALFAMTLIGARVWQTSESHPAMQTRIDRTIQVMGTDGKRVSDIIAHAAFAALWRLYPDAPGPFKMRST